VPMSDIALRAITLVSMASALETRPFRHHSPTRVGQRLVQPLVQVETKNCVERNEKAHEHLAHEIHLKQNSATARTELAQTVNGFTSCVSHQG
jgi:ribosomal protein L32